MSYTKGKWINQGGVIMTDKPRDRIIIARVENPNQFSVDEVIANSQLITAAPELYEALRAIYMHVPPSKEEWGNAAKALAKADGK